MNNLVYCTYGGKPYTQEAVFSILSAIRCERGEQQDWRLVIYTDEPSAFTLFDPIIEPLTAQRLEEWAGPASFGYRMKIFALWHALQNYGPSVLVDSDTYFLKPAERLFDRIGVGNSIMHLREGRLRQFSSNLDLLFKNLCATPFEVSGQSYEFTPDWLMWNAGVVGMSPMDEHLLETVVSLTDAIHQRTPSMLSEQIAFTKVLESATRLSDVEDIIYHYWPAFLRTPFHTTLTNLWRAPLQGNPKKLAKAFYKFRPRARKTEQMKAKIKTILFKMGLRDMGLHSSAF